MAKKYPDYVRAYTASEELGVPTYGGICAHTDPRTNTQKSACEIYIVEVDTGKDKETYVCST